MPPAADELRSHATSSEDFYALLSLPATFTPKELDRAWRRAALRFHPDKAGTGASARAKFHLASVAYEILGDEQLRATYDGARSVRERRRQELDRLEAGKRAAREDLERREREGGVKRSAGAAFGQAGAGFRSAGDDPAGFGGSSSADTDEAREQRRLAEEGRRMREARTEEMRAKRHEAKVAAVAARSAATAEAPRDTHRTVDEREPVHATPLDRSVRMFYSKESGGASALTPVDVRKAFHQAFGGTEAAIAFKDKKIRTAPGKPKKPCGTVVVVFSSLLGSHAAFVNWRNVRDRKIAAEGEDAQAERELWGLVEEVEYAGGEEPPAVLSWMTHNLTRGSPHLEKEGAPTLEELNSMKMRYADRKKKEREALEKSRMEEERRATQAGIYEDADFGGATNDGRATGTTRETTGARAARVEMESTENKAVPKFSFSTAPKAKDTGVAENGGFAFRRMKRERLQHEEEMQAFRVSELEKIKDEELQEFQT